MPSPATSMPPSLAAAATERRINGTWSMKRTMNPSKEQNCTVRLHGDLIVRYKIRAVGGPVLPQHRQQHEDAPRRFDQSFRLHDADEFFRSYTASHNTIHQMLMQTPVLREFDLGADNWEHFMPHYFATSNVQCFRSDTLRLGGVALRFNLDIALAISVNVLYNEPRALLLACVHEAAAAGRRLTPAAECCVCMEVLAADQEDTVVKLSCSHSFHPDCIAPWFYRAATCPMCRHDVSNCLAALTGTPRGKFPAGLRP